MKKYLLYVLLLSSFGCVDDKKKVSTKIEKKNTPAKVVKEKNIKKVFIKLIPLGKVNESFCNDIFKKLREIVPNIEIKEPEKMPELAYYAPRGRYRADKLIQWLSSRAKENEVYAGITMNDISTTKGSNYDFGVMGLGYNPGNACISSSHRVKDKGNFYKIVIHEIGHTAGLPHCPVQTCFMRDAEGRDPTGEEKEFCTDCKKHLTSRGWKL